MKYQKTHCCQIKNLPEIYQKYFDNIIGSFVEVGAFDCYTWSNTHNLALAGWQGLLIEPQIEYHNKCLELYKDNPKIILEQCCIGRKNGKTKLYLGGSTTTIKRGMIETYNSIDWAKFGGLDKDNYVECDIFTLDTMLKKHSWPVGFEVLVIDVEGAEIDVLQGFDLAYWRPQMIIIEVHEQYEDKRLSGKAKQVDKILTDYDKIYSDHINNIYVNKR